MPLFPPGNRKLYEGRMCLLVSVGSSGNMYATHTHAQPLHRPISTSTHTRAPPTSLPKATSPLDPMSPSRRSLHDIPQAPPGHFGVCFIHPYSSSSPFHHPQLSLTHPTYTSLPEPSSLTITFTWPPLDSKFFLG